MAYTTGSGNTILDFVTALKNFAVAQGWILGKFDTTDKLLFIENGECHVAFQWDDAQTVTVWSIDGLTSTTTDDHKLRGVLGSSLNNAKTAADWFEQPGTTAVITGSNDSDNLMVNILTGVFTAWHFFSNATGDYIHAVAQTGQIFTHLSFGVLDQGDLTHAGVAYLTGTFNIWWKQSSDTDPNAFGLSYNKPSRHTRYPGGHSEAFNNHGMYYASDALPSGFDDLHGIDAKVVTPFVFLDTPQAGIGSGQSSLASHLIMANAPTWSDVVPMFGIPMVIKNVNNDQTCAPGFYPDIRVINMEGLEPGEELDLSGDTWKVFPQLRQAAWADSGAIFAASSGHYGVAIKKIP